MNNFLFEKSLIIGMGLMGSSLARGLKNKKISKKVFGYDKNNTIKEKCNNLKILDHMIGKLDSINEYDLIVLCTPLSSYNRILSKVVPLVSSPCIITDIGSTKESVVKEYNRFIKNKKLEFVPGHPIAGLEKSGPEYGFTDLFKNRYCILTPKNKNTNGVKKISKMWERLGMKIEFMNPKKHDRLLAMTSHIPQLIAYSIVATATDLGEKTRNEIIKFSAAGFRDFTRLAGSDPIMWRDIYSLNKKFVLEMLNRFIKDLSNIQKAINSDDKKSLEKTFKLTKKIRKQIEIAGQAGTFDPRER